MSTTSDFLLADARTALRRRLTKPCRTKLSRAFAAWVLREPETDIEFVSLVSDAAEREGAQQDFQTVAILGFGADARILGAAQIEVLKKGLRRHAGREVLIDGLPVSFCSDAVGVLGIALGTRAVADPVLAGQVAKWASKFLKNSYDMEHAEDWHRCLYAVADQQLGSSLNLPFPNLAATADIRTALITRNLIEIGSDGQAAQDDEQTLRLAIRELPSELSCDRAALRLAAVESIIRTATPSIAGEKAGRAAKRDSPLSPRDLQIHDAVGAERFRTLANAEIMREAGVKKRLRAGFKLESGDAVKRSFDRIRQAKGYPLSREIAKKRSNNK